MTDAIHDKIRKLLALAGDGANEHESARAMELATAMMLKHNISQDAFKEKPVVARGDDIEADLAWLKTAAQAAGHLYACRPVWLGDKFRYVGRSDNIDASQQTYHFIVEQIETLYKQALPKGMSKSERAIWRKEFKYSAARRVFSRAVEIVANVQKEDVAVAATGSTALVVVAQRKQLEQEVNDFFQTIGVRHVKSRGVSVGRSTGTTAGRAAGDKVRLNRAVK